MRSNPGVQETPYLKKFRREFESFSSRCLNGLVASELKVKQKVYQEFKFEYMEILHFVPDGPSVHLGREFQDLKSVLQDFFCHSVCHANVFVVVGGGKEQMILFAVGNETKMSTNFYLFDYPSKCIPYFILL